MDTKTTLSISEARKKIFKIADEVQKVGIRYTLTDKGSPKAVVLSAEEFESWMETLEVAKDFPNLKSDIKKANDAVKSGKYKKYATLEDILKKEGYILTKKTR
ncbi:type II toxin-antitoxin system Phd/YefM family antitoxin [Candidatus Azambacteria bacterium]|nr:type II toxin-antitoxin system Phd/YefM family antitoxin [Candidatus Azambacteria bacterium]